MSAANEANAPDAAGISVTPVVATSGQARPSQPLLQATGGGSYAWLFGVGS